MKSVKTLLNILILTVLSFSFIGANDAMAGKDCPLAKKQAQVTSSIDLIERAPSSLADQVEAKDELHLAAGCCKICTKGNACGNSCISKAYRCHQPPGCACDGD